MVDLCSSKFLLPMPLLAPLAPLLEATAVSVVSLHCDVSWAGCWTSAWNKIAILRLKNTNKVVMEIYPTWMKHGLGNFYVENMEYPKHIYNLSIIYSCNSSIFFSIYQTQFDLTLLAAFTIHDTPLKTNVWKMQVGKQTFPFKDLVPFQVTCLFSGHNISRNNWKFKETLHVCVFSGIPIAIWPRNEDINLHPQE